MQTPVEHQSLRGKRILVVDDVIDNQILECCFLRRLGVITDVASNGVEAVQKALTGNYDAVLMDLHMPEMDGISATVQLRSQGFQKPIIAVTADVLDTIRQRVLSSGFNDYLSKPLCFQGLTGSLEKHISVGSRVLH